MIYALIPRLQDSALYQFLTDILRRAVDGTRRPLVVDEVNQRVLVGAAAASTTNIGKVEVTGGDVKVISTGYGVVIPNRSGTAYYRLIMEDNGVISADPL